jgi:hypothetical protein
MTSGPSLRICQTHVCSERRGRGLHGFSGSGFRTFGTCPQRGWMLIRSARCDSHGPSCDDARSLVALPPDASRGIEALLLGLIGPKHADGSNAKNSA